MMKISKKIIFFFSCLLLFPHNSLLSLTLQRVILACDNNPNYIQFWPIAAKLWQEIVGVKPTLALIAPADVIVDETLGDVIRFEPIEGVPTSLYAQCVRLLLPCLFPDDVCIVSDIDLLPLQNRFFTKYIKKLPEDSFVIYRARYWFFKKRIYMSYNAAKGSVWQEIFGVKTYDDIPSIICSWEKLGVGWSTDERLLYKYLTAWKKNNKHRLKKLGFWFDKKKRISYEENLDHDVEKLNKSYYIEINCPRPYEIYKDKIDQIAQLAIVASQKSKKLKKK